jgi:hypothetical protein
MRINKLIWIMAVSVLASVPAAWGNVAACASPQPLGPAVVGAGNGCWYQDANFDNFNVSSATGGGSSLFPLTTGITSGSTDSTNIQLTPPPGTTVDTLAFKSEGTSSETSCSTQSWCVSQSSSLASQSFTYGVVGSVDYLSLSDGTVASPAQSGNVITTEEQFCLGSTTFNCGTMSATYGYLKVQQTSTGTGQFTTVFTVCTPGAGGCTTATPGAAGITILPQTQIAIQDTVSISTQATLLDPVFIDGFDNEFDTPEPSTFILLGGALAGLGLLRFRHRKA